MQSWEQGVAVLVWQSRIIVLYMSVSPLGLLLLVLVGGMGNIPLIGMARHTCLCTPIPELLNPSCHIPPFLFCSNRDYADGDLKEIEKCS